MSILFWVFAILSTFSFSLQWALTAKYARDGDPLSIWMYRSLSLIITMLPLLFFSNFENIGKILLFQEYLIPAWFLAGIWVWLRYQSNLYLPVWLSNICTSVAGIFTAVIVGLLFFAENLSILIILCIIVTILGWIIVSLSKTNFHHLDNVNFLRGIFFASLSGIIGTGSVMLMVHVSRELDPFVAWYFWEVEIGIALVIIAYTRNYFFDWAITKISRDWFYKILLASSPTLLGTWWLALASIYWPVWVLSVVSVLGIVFSVILWIILFWEKLKLLQYIGIIIIVAWILWIKIFS